MGIGRLIRKSESDFGGEIRGGVVLTLSFEIAEKAQSQTPQPNPLPAAKMRVEEGMVLAPPGEGVERRRW